MSERSRRGDRPADTVPAGSVGRRVGPLLPTVAVSYIGYAMMATLFVPMLMSPDEGYLPSDASLATRTGVIGVLLMLYPLGQFFGNPLLGGLSDRLGRRPIILASTAATVVCYVGIATALSLHNLVLLAPFLLLCGLVEATIALTMSTIADVTDERQRPRWIGYVYATTSVSYTVGPVGGGLIAERLGFALPFWIIAIALVPVLGWLLLRFTETLAQGARRATPLLRSLGALSQVFTDRSLRRSYLANFLVFVAAMGFWRVITIYLVDEWQLSVGQVTACYAALAITAGIANLVLMPRLADRVSMSRLAVVTLVTGAISMAAVTVPSAAGVPLALAWAVGLAAVASLLLALALSAVAAALSAAAPPDRQGVVLGNNAALLVLGEVVGVSVGSFLAGVTPALPLLVLAGFAVVAPVILRRGRTPVPPSV